MDLTDERRVLALLVAQKTADGDKESPCARWTGAARITDASGRRVRADRYVYSVMRGELRHGDVLVRTCSTPWCASPHHRRVERIERNFRSPVDNALLAERRVGIAHALEAHAKALHALIAADYPDELRPRMPERIVAEARALRLDVATALVDEPPRTDVPEIRWRRGDFANKNQRATIAARCPNVLCECQSMPDALVGAAYVSDGDETSSSSSYCQEPLSASLDDESASESLWTTD